MSETEGYLSLALKIILIISIISGVYNHLWHIVSTDFFLLILMFVPQIVKSKYNIKFPAFFEWSLLIFAVVLLLLGDISGIITPIFFGIFISFLGFMILAILYSTNQIKKNYFLILFFSFNFSIAFGVAIELAKYYLKILLKYPISADGLMYSMQTLTFVVIGASISVIIGFVYMKFEKSLLRNFFKVLTEKNPTLFKRRIETSKEELDELLKKGENERIEFKSTFRTNLHTNEIDRKIEYSILKTLAAFLNSKGGILLVGISDSKEIVGLEKDNFEDLDKFSLHITNLIKSKLGKNASPLIDIEFIQVDEKNILKLECRQSKTPVFIRSQTDEEEFYIRAGPSSVQIKGSELLEYIEKNFKRKRD